MARHSMVSIRMERWPRSISDMCVRCAITANARAIARYARPQSANMSASESPAHPYRRSESPLRQPMKLSVCYSLAEPV